MWVISHGTMKGLTEISGSIVLLHYLVVVIMFCAKRNRLLIMCERVSKNWLEGSRQPKFSVYFPILQG